MLTCSMVHSDISIHAPREGSDENLIESVRQECKFQSTLPVRGATCYNRNCKQGRGFQSTLPVRGATANRYKNAPENLCRVHLFDTNIIRHRTHERNRKCDFQENHEKTWCEAAAVSCTLALRGQISRASSGA